MAQATNMGPWTPHENELIVAFYFRMLELEMSNKPYNKREQNRELQKLIGRSSGSIEFKHQNISAVLHRLGLPFIQGYKPKINFQASLVDAVARQLAHSERLAEALGSYGNDFQSYTGQLQVDSEPPAVEEPTNDASVAMRNLVNRFNPAERDARNRELGRSGEQLVLDAECRQLILGGRRDLAARVCWVSEEVGDGAGYDIHSFDLEGKERLLEVKTTRGDAHTPFYLSSNEYRVSKERATNYRLVRVYDFLQSPKVFELRPPLETSVRLSPTSFIAQFW